MSRIQDKESFAWRKIGTFMCAMLNALKKLAAFLPRKQIIFLAAG
jgi:hypothetical protein